MLRDNVKVLLKLFDIMKNHYTEEAFFAAIYIYVRYGYKTFEKEIKSKKLKKISEVLKEQKILFDEDLAYRIDKILDEEQ